MTDFERQLRECDTESLNEGLRQYGIEPTYVIRHYDFTPKLEIAKPLTPKQYGQALLNRKKKRK